jgi:hypothetical protein
MGESKAGFMVEEEDTALARALQESELREAKQRPESAMYHPNSMNSSSIAPKMVVTQSFLTTPGASPFCTCVAASRFLTGGVVTSEFLNSILQGGIEMFRKTSGNSDYDVQKVLKKFGKKELGIEAIIHGDLEPKVGIFMEHDLHHTMGLRSLLTQCRNEQPVGWQVLLLESQFESFCICLPPKGTKNKFWYLDFTPRAQFRVPGAYARVHGSLLQLEESLESIFTHLTQYQSKGHESFSVCKIKKLKP